MSKKYDPVTLLLKESENYGPIDQMETYVENKGDLSVLPVQPLYLALKQLPLEKVAQYLPQFSKEQRQVFLDIDLWQKDTIDTVHFKFWLKAYAMCTSEEVKRDFVSSEQFLLYLKGQFNVWTFDVEDPNYPDHDYYFLTEDSLLLFEFDESFELIDEVRYLISHLYYEMGVENAYAFLFKMVSDSFMAAEEEEYQNRKSRMRDFGFVDYLDALELENPFIGIDFVDMFIKKKSPAGGGIDVLAKNQNIHNSSLVAFKDHFKRVIDELLKISDPKRSDYLQFNFVRLINARLENQNALKKGSVAMARAGAQTKNYILLGLDYINHRTDLITLPSEGAFYYFDFTDLYKIGLSLVRFELKVLKKSLGQYGLDGDNEKFLGDHWSEFLDHSFDSPIKFKATKKHDTKVDAKVIEGIVDYKCYQDWQISAQTLISLLPLAQNFLKEMNRLSKEGRLVDSFYLNYSVDAINFESLLLSQFAFLFLQIDLEKGPPRLGLTIKEFRAFCSELIDTSTMHIVKDDKLEKTLDQFIKNFQGLLDAKSFPLFRNYLVDILKNHLEGFLIQDLNDEELRHVGGPIILNGP